MGKIKKCASCNTYTMAGQCPACGSEAASPEPPAFSFPDRYGEYRRQAKASDEE